VSTEKLIDFDLAAALKDPSRVRRSSSPGWRAVRVLDVPEAGAENRVLVVWRDVGVGAYSEDGRLILDGFPVLKLVAETRFVPWESVADVPEGIVLREITTRKIYSVQGWRDSCIQVGTAWFEVRKLDDHFEYATSHRATEWHPCVKEVG
jgi:hypothetical protein